jgi:NTP pyrophosphatase (non-canonical NTP hydrolase)
MKEETNPTWKEVHGGYAKDMTLRDEFAGRAMQILKDSVWNFELLAVEAYELADAMLKARDAK